MFGILLTVVARFVPQHKKEAMEANSWFNFLCSSAISYKEMADWAAIAASSLPPTRHEKWEALSAQELAGADGTLANSAYVLDFFVRGYWEPSLTDNAKLCQILAVRLWLASAILKGLQGQGGKEEWAPFYAALIIARLVTCSYGLQWLISQLFQVKQDGMLNAADLLKLITDNTARELRNKYSGNTRPSCLTADISPTHKAEKQGQIPEAIQTTAACSRWLQCAAKDEGMNETAFLQLILLKYSLNKQSNS